MKTTICDLCGSNTPEIKIVKKAKAFRMVFSLSDATWSRIDICYKCLDDILRAREERMQKDKVESEV